MERQFLTAILPFSSLTMWILKNFHSLCYLRICGYRNFEIFSLAVGTNKTTNSGWMIAKDETKPRDETVENVRGYQTFILWKSTNTSLYNIQKLEVAVHARMHSHVYTRSSSNLDPNILLTFCDGDCISLLFHTLPLLGETDSLSTSRKTYFLGYPDGVEIKGIAEIKRVGKIKEGQWCEIAEIWCPQHALAVASRVRSSHPSFVLSFFSKVQPAS